MLDNYTTEEALVYYRAIMRRKADETARIATMFRTASGAKKLAFKRYIRHLESMPRLLDQAASIKGPAQTVEGIFARVNGVTIRQRNKKTQRADH